MAELEEGKTASRDSAGPQIADTVVETQDEFNSVVESSTTRQSQIEDALIKEDSVKNIDPLKEKSAQNLSSLEQKRPSDALLEEKSALSETTSNQKLVSSHVSLKQSTGSKSSKQELRPEISKEQSAQSLIISKSKLLSNAALKEKSAQSVTKSNQKVVSSDALSKKQSVQSVSSKQNLESKMPPSQTDSVPEEKSGQMLTTSKQKLLSDEMLLEKSAQSVTTSSQKEASDISSKKTSESSKQKLQENEDLEEISGSRQKVGSSETISRKVSLHGDISDRTSRSKISDLAEGAEPKDQSAQSFLKEKQSADNYQSEHMLAKSEHVETPTRTASAGSMEDPVLSEFLAQQQERPLLSVDRETLLIQLRTLMNDRSMLLLRNNMLNRRMAEYYRKRNLDHALKEVENIGGVDFEELYKEKLLAYEEMKVKEEEEIAEIERVLHENEIVRDQHRQQAEEAFAHLQQTERSVGIGLIDTRYGKRIPDKVVERLLSLQASRAHDTSILRLRWLRARDAAARLEQAVRALDTVAGGLRVADYHQLLLDSQTYMEKIEDREGELARYRVSCTGHGAAAAHAREKLRCLDARAVEALDEREEVERDYRDARDQLNKEKMEHDRLRTALLKEQFRAGLLGKRELLYDYDDTLDEIKMLKENYEELLRECQKFNRSEPKSESDDWVCWK